MGLLATLLTVLVGIAIVRAAVPKVRKWFVKIYK